MELDRSWYSFDAAGYRFFVLDSIRVSHDEYKYHGHVSSEQIEWLQEELSRTPRDMPLVVVLHIPLLTVFYEATEGATFGAQPNRVVTNNMEVLESVHEPQSHTGPAGSPACERTTAVAGYDLYYRWRNLCPLVARTLARH